MLWNPWYNGIVHKRVLDWLVTAPGVGFVVYDYIFVLFNKERGLSPDVERSVAVNMELDREFGTNVIICYRGVRYWDYKVKRVCLCDLQKEFDDVVVYLQ